MTAAPSSLHHHGGNLAAAAQAYGRPVTEWLDLSTGINPEPYPVPPVPPEAWTRLPEPAALEALEQAARQAYDCATDAAVVAAPGTQMLIQWLPRLRTAGAVAVVTPTYGEHAAAWSAAGHAVRAATTPEAGVAAGADVIILCNPNNPDGRRYAPQDLLDLAAAQAARGGWLIVDEAFADVAPEVSLCPRAGVPGLIVLRSPGKFYGLAGLRLGLAVCGADVAGPLAQALGPWAVSGPALAVGTAALADTAWRDRTRQDLVARRAALDGILASSGLLVAGGTDLFRLVETPEAAALFQRLCRAGVLVRPFSYAPHWLRFGLPGTDADLARLNEALNG